MSRKAAITGAAYHVFAEGVRRIPDEATRKAMADHFATYFHSRSPSFDPQAWFMATGGRVQRVLPIRKLGDDPSPKTPHQNLGGGAG